MVIEFEIDEIYLKCGRVRDDGKFPTVSSMRDGVFSRKASVKYVMEQLVNAFENRQT